MPDPDDKRILVVDENPAVHKDFYKAFCIKNDNVKLMEIERVLFPDKIKQTSVAQAVSYLIDSAYQGEQALKLVQQAVESQHPYTMAFIDLYPTSGWDGITTIQRIWEVDPDFQVVMCTAYADYSWQELARKLQRSDNFLILNKPFDVSEIRQLVLYLSKKGEIKNQIQEQIYELEAKVVHQTTHDSLTGLGNRLLLIDCVRQAIEKAKQHAQFFGVLLVALDNLKEINTVFGYALGDALLKIIAEKLKNNNLKVDTIIRSGGNEFVIILTPEASKENLVTKVNQLQALFLTSWKIETNLLLVTTSIGVSIYPCNGQEADTLLKNADAALYHAKKTGKNNIQFYIKEYHEYLLRRMELMASLRYALDNKQFVLHYQPLVKSDSGQILGVEALIRWQHPSLGLLYPQEFITLAEEIDLIISIDEWVLKTACTRVKKWQESIYPELKIAVNVSAHQLCQANFVERICKILNKTELEPRYLELEIITSHILKANSDTLQKMHKLKEMGVHFSIGHFGVGCANLNYLQYLPFDKVKIDKSFINNIQLNDKENVVVESIINIAKKLGMKVVAEGVEMPEQVEFLFNHHGDQMQGYYFSPPLNEEACAKLLEKQGSIAKEGA